MMQHNWSNGTDSVTVKEISVTIKKSDYTLLPHENLNTHGWIYEIHVKDINDNVYHAACISRNSSAHAISFVESILRTGIYWVQQQYTWVKDGVKLSLRDRWRNYWRKKFYPNPYD